MINGRIALPTNSEGGLNGQRSEHFGHCDTFTLIDIKDGKISTDSALKNVSHEHGGCMVPVTLLANNNVDAVVVVGIGHRPLIRFNDLDIDVYIDKVNVNVKDSVMQLVNGNLEKMSAEHSCGGGGNCH